MRKALEQFPKQFLWEPVMENAAEFRHRARVIVCGMGGSHLAADIIKSWKPELRVRIWSDYDVPEIPESEKEDALIIASSYSGNTEEVLSAYFSAQKQKIPLLCVSAGGKLLDYAVRDSAPFIKMPDTGIQPRMALGFSIKALLKALGEEQELINISRLAESLSPEASASAGKKLAAILQNKIPVIYAARRNEVVAKIWKIKLNEGAKIPAFYNVFPELNHNEMIGYETIPLAKTLSEKFYFVFLKYADDSPEILKRMEITEDIFAKHGLAVESVWMRESNRWQSLFAAIFLIDWTALELAEYYHVNPETVGLIEEFKTRMNDQNPSQK